MTDSAPLLVTCALPYANGPLHLGHLVGYIQGDIWVRAQRMAGREAFFVCADDAHGTPIMLAAEKAGLAPEDFIRDIQRGHEADFAAFHVDFDFYHSTHSDENRELATRIYTRLRDATHWNESVIARRAITQLYDPARGMFLPDRYVKGECPNCHALDQYGDNCEVCGKAYAPTDLINPRSVVSGATPELRESEHYFFELGKFDAFLREWLAGGVAHPGVKAKLDEWLQGGLRDWDISRDAPYFGFPIPDAPGKFFYVWLDAPIGYLASFKALCESDKAAARGLSPERFEALLAPDSGTSMHHFIGKDIINFHGLFWPAMLRGAGLVTPERLHVNGYLTVNGAKMSKSRGTFVMARTYLDAGLDPEYLRYYFATKTSGGVDDLDLNLEDFALRVNSDLVGKFVNIASRCAKLLEVHFENQLGNLFPAADKSEPQGYEKLAIEMLTHVTVRLDRTFERYENDQFGKLASEVMAVADVVNEYIASSKPWALAKSQEQRHELHCVLTASLNAFAAISVVLKPILPEQGRRASEFLNSALGLELVRGKKWLFDHKINSFVPLMSRIDLKQIESMVDASKETLPGQPVDATAPTKPVPTKLAAATKAASPAAKTDTASGIVTIDDFAKLDLRIGVVRVCEFVEGSDKLLRLELDAGDLGTRQIFSGIREAYTDPAALVGRRVVFIANLAPRKMRFGVSEGMILSAGSGGASLFLLDADDGALPGMPVK